MVAVLVAVLSIAKGFQHAMTVSGSPDTAIILRSGADGEMMSGLGGPTTRIIADTEGVARGAEGPMASAELFVIIDRPMRSTGSAANVPLRGVEPAAFDVRDRIEIVEGRKFEWGKNEVIVGYGASVEFGGLEVGGKIPVGKEEWSVVGRFSANGGIAESEIWTDAAVLQPAYRRGNSFQSVYAKLDSPEAFQGFKDRLTTDPRLNVKVIRQPDFYAEQSTMITNLITGLGTLVAVLMGIGAIFGALNTMYTGCFFTDTRDRDAARAWIPWSSGGDLGSCRVSRSGSGGWGDRVAVWLTLSSTVSAPQRSIGKLFSQVAFAFDVTPELLVQGIVYASAIGLVGGLFPAVRAARMPVATALREL